MKRETLRHLLVCGSRLLSDEPYRDLTRRVVREVIRAWAPDTMLVVGDARGPDEWAFEWHRGPVMQLTPAWSAMGPKAGPIRNGWMLDLLPEGSTVIAFWDGNSRGTKHTIGEARRRGFDVRVWTPEEGWV